MGRRIHLNRRLELEDPVTVPDGGGGTTQSWVSLGSHWAEIRPGSGRHISGQEMQQSLVTCRIIVRAAPFGAPSRPKPGQRFTEGARRFQIVAVTEMPPAARYLICFAREEVLP